MKGTGQTSNEKSPMGSLLGSLRDPLGEAGAPPPQRLGMTLLMAHSSPLPPTRRRSALRQRGARQRLHLPLPTGDMPQPLTG